MAHFADQLEIGVKFPMRAASVDPKSPDYTSFATKNMGLPQNCVTRSQRPQRAQRLMPPLEVPLRALRARDAILIFACCS